MNADTHHLVAGPLCRGARTPYAMRRGRGSRAVLIGCASALCSIVLAVALGFGAAQQDTDALVSSRDSLTQSHKTHMPDSDLGLVIARLPDTIEFVVAMDDGATLRQSLGSSPFVLSALSIPQAARVLDAWSSLADELGMDDQEAFDLLLGRRVVFVASGLQTGDEIHWALLSELDQTTERRLRADLGAKPRHIIAGQSVLELENGSFLLATSTGQLRCPTTATPGPTALPHPTTNPGSTANASGLRSGTSTVLLLAPSADRAFFASMLPLLHCHALPHPLGNTPGGRAIVDMPTGQTAFLWRLPDPANAPDRFIAGTLAPDQTRWSLSLRAGRPNDWIPELDTTRLNAWTPSQLQMLPANPVLAVMGLREFVSQTRNWVMPGQPSSITSTDDASVENLLGEHSLVAVWLPQADDGLLDAEPNPEVLYATETTDIKALARQGDALISRRLQALNIPTTPTTPTDTGSHTTNTATDTASLSTLMPPATDANPTMRRMRIPAHQQIEYPFTSELSAEDELSPTTVRSIKLMRFESDTSAAATAPSKTKVESAHTTSGARINWMYLPRSQPQSNSQGWWIIHYQPDAGKAFSPADTRSALGKRNLIQAHTDATNRTAAAPTHDASKVLPALSTARRYLHVGSAQTSHLAGLMTTGAMTLSDESVHDQPAHTTHPSMSASTTVLSLLGANFDHIQWAVWVVPDNARIDATIWLSPSTAPTAP